LFVFFFAGSVSANDTVTKFQCGESSVTIYNSNVIDSPFFVVTVENLHVFEHYSFRVTAEYLHARCEKNKRGKDFLLINQICGGTACAESNYGIIDLATGKEVLKPSAPYRGNGNKAVAILGKQIKPFSTTGKPSAGSSSPNEEGEYWLVSPLEIK